MKIRLCIYLVVIALSLGLKGYPQYNKGGGSQKTNENYAKGGDHIIGADYFGSLYIKEMCVIDNGEGVVDNWPFDHGPVGNIHIRIYEITHTSYLHKDVDKNGNVPSGYIGHSYCCDKGLNEDIVVKGPTLYDGKYEWEDYDVKIFNQPQEIWRWRDYTDEVKIVFYESDPYRAHEPLANIVVNRQVIVDGKELFMSDLYSKDNKHVYNENPGESIEWLKKNFPYESKKKLGDLRIMYIKFGVW